MLHLFKFYMFVFIIIIIIVKLLSFNIIDIYNDDKLFFYGLFSLAIAIQLFDLFLLHTLSIKKYKIPEILPQFIINYIKHFKSIKGNRPLIQEVKKDIYINIRLYLFFIFLYTIIIILYKIFEL